MSLIGQYVRNIRIEKQLGLGGMGEVYLGFDEGLKRHVAIKAIRDERRMNPKTRARFNREARVLSQLEHPNICRIYDYVQGDECDLLIMEYIDGKTLLDVGQSADTDFRQKIRLAKDIAGVLAVAHEKHIVHRDLKPDNVMITKDGTVKVLDFGLAHTVTRKGQPLEARENAAEQTTTDDLAVFQDGETIVVGNEPSRGSSGFGYTYFETELGTITGTPAFMSPEQARGESVSAASDMFAFGQLLHWLFTGQSPYPKDLDRMQILFRAMQGQTRPVEGLSPELTDLIERLKSMSPDLRPPAVETVKRLTWIESRPRRRRLRMITAAVIISLCVTTAIAVWGFFKARHTARQAEISEAKVRVVNDFLISMLSSADPTKMGKDIKVLDVLDTAAADVDRRFDDHRENLAEVHAALGATYRALGEWDKAKTHFNREWETKKQLYGDRDVKTLEAESNLGMVLRDLGRYQQADEIQTRFLETTKRELGSQHPLTMRAMERVMAVWYRQARFVDGEEICRQLLEARMAELGPKDPKTLATIHALGAMMYGQGNFVEAEREFRRALDGKLKVFGRSHPESIDSLSSVAAACYDQGRTEEAGRLFAQVLDLRIEVLGKDHPDTLETMHSLGVVAFISGQYERALSRLEPCLELRQNSLGNDHPKTLDTLNAMAAVVCDMGQYARAEELFRACFEAQETKLGLEHPDTLRSMLNVAIAIGEQGRHQEAEAIIVENWELRRQALGEDHWETLVAGSALAECLSGQGRPAEAAAILIPLVEKKTRVLGVDHRETRHSCVNLGRILVDLGRIGEAGEYYQKAIASHLNGEDGQTEKAYELLRELADVYEKSGQRQAMIDCLQRAARHGDEAAQERLTRM